MIYEAEQIKDSKMLADWAVVGVTYAGMDVVSKQVYAWIPRWHLNAEGIAEVIARQLNEVAETQDDNYKYLNN